jgi:hypothetical protein
VGTKESRETVVTSERTIVTGDKQAYRVFLLRVWRAAGGWRAALEEPHTGRRYGFADPHDLLDFLDQHADGTLSTTHDTQGEAQ